MATRSPLLNALPQARFLGTKDESQRSVGRDPVVYPIHMPLFFIFSSWGTSDAIPGVGAALTEEFGTEFTDVRGKYATHVTPFINLMQKNANQMLVKRLKPEDAGDPATLVLALDICASNEVPEYETEDGYYKYGNDGALIETGTKVTGHVAKWVLLKNTTGFVGRQTKTTGSFQIGTTQSQIVPIIEFQAKYFGARGNNFGVRLSCPNKQSFNPVNTKLVDAIKARLYDLEIVELQDGQLTPTTYKNKYSEPTTQFSFKQGAYDKINSRDMFIDDMLLDQYQNLTLDPKQYGPLGHVYVYHDNLAEILKDAWKKEKVKNDQYAKMDDDAYHMLNFVTGTDIEGRPYKTFVINTKASEGALTLNERATHYLSGSSDGTMGNEAYDRLVKRELDNLGNLDVNWDDIAEYPFSEFYDTGFNDETKESIMKLLGLDRQDVNITLSTYVAGSQANTVSEEASRLVALNAKALNYPESEYWGTSTCRATIVEQSGISPDRRIKSRVPMTYEIANFRSRYMGSGDGKFKSGYGYDRSPNNEVKLLEEISTTFKPYNVRVANWTNGATSFISKRRKLPFCPAVQTVYPDDTSVLNSDINVRIVSHINRICFYVWTELTGANLSDNVLIKMSDDLIEEMCRDCFDNRAIITPKTQLDERDKLRGWSWKCVVEAQLPNQKTVSTNWVVAKRLEENGV